MVDPNGTHFPPSSMRMSLGQQKNRILSHPLSNHHLELLSIELKLLKTKSKGFLRQDFFQQNLKQQFFPQKSLFPHSLAQSGIVFTHDFGQVDDCSLRKKKLSGHIRTQKTAQNKSDGPLTRFFHTLKTENNIKALQLDLSLISHRFSVFSRSVLSFQSSTWHQGSFKKKTQRIAAVFLNFEPTQGTKNRTLDEE